MRVHTTTTSAFLTTMADCLERDPASVSGWSCLVMPGLLPAGLAEAKMPMLAAQFEPLDGALLLGADGDVVILFRGLGGAGAERLLGSIREALDGAELGEGRSYDVFSDWPMVLEEFRQQVGRLGTQRVQQAATIDAEEQKGIEHMTRVLLDSKFSRTYRSPMTVMLVEDDPITARMAGKLLGQDHVLVSAANAYEAVVNYLLYAPELVFLDINLPDGSGFQVLDQLTACDPDAYIVMFSGSDAIDTIMDSRRRGARGFVVKPFQRDRLRHFLAEREREVLGMRS